MIIGSKLVYYEKLSSTNTQIIHLLKGGELKEGTVIYTGFQEAGKGHAGNRWESEAYKNLLFSIILYPEPVVPEDQFLISMTLSLGICDFIDIHSGGSKIKWPNDIYIKDDKIAGILIENSLLGRNIENSVAGIGININQVSFSENIPNPVSLRVITGKEFDTFECLKQLLGKLDQKYKSLLYGDRMALRKEYISRLYRFGEWHNFRKAGSVFKGRIKDVTLSGRLIVEDQTGKKGGFSFKEIEFIR